jgi:hypothetical protein
MSFDPILCQEYVETLIRHDELERALLVLDNIPAQYRMDPPDNLKQLRGDILAASVTPYRYTISMSDEVMKEDPKEKLEGFLDKTLRASIVRDQVRLMNDNGMVPHLVDYGPGPYLLPRALLAAGHKFTYWDLPLNHQARKRAHEILAPVLSPENAKTKATIFLALEVIEHLSNPGDLAVEAIRNCGRWPEMVMLSTPFCTFRVIPEEEEWRNWQLEHLRAYTPQEFQAVACRIFPPYVWNFEHVEGTNEPMSLIGTRIDLVEAAKHTEIVTAHTQDLENAYN